MGYFLRIKALPGLKQYKYSSQDDSLISKYVLKPFYARFVLLFPLWVAPNLITLLGLFFTLISVALTIYYNPGFDGESPRWVYFVYALNFFLYQTFDACDGLQARRTGTSSPLGELFDHTVDAINTTLGVIIFSATVNLHWSYSLISLFITTFNFYLSTWEEFHTGSLYLSVFSGPVEGVLIVIATQIVTGFTGPQLWTSAVYKGYSVTEIYMPFLALAVFFNIASAAGNVGKALSSKRREKTKNDEETATLSVALRRLSPFFILWVGFLSWINVMPALVYEHLTLLILVVGSAFALQVGRVITAHVTKQAEYPFFDPLMFLPYGAVFVHYVLGPILGWSAPSIETASIWTILGLSIGVYGLFVADIITEITEYLGINALTIPHKSKTD